MIGIIASLIYVGLELRQTREIAIAGQYSERAGGSTEYWQFVAGQPVLLGNFGRAHRDYLKNTSEYDDALTDEEVGLLYVQARYLIAALDNNYYQYATGFMTEESWDVYAYRIRGTCRPGWTVRAVVENHPENFRRSFVEACLYNAEE